MATPASPSAPGPRVGTRFSAPDEGRVACPATRRPSWPAAGPGSMWPLRLTIPASGIRLYADGRPVGAGVARSSLAQAGGRGGPRPGQRHGGPGPAPRTPSARGKVRGRRAGSSLDAILDELKVHSRGAPTRRPSSGPGRGRAREAAPPNCSPLPPRRMPSGGRRPGPFGAAHAKLAYHWEWDDLWRVGDCPDVVVRFEGSPARSSPGGASAIPRPLGDRERHLGRRPERRVGQRGGAASSTVRDIQCRYSARPRPGGARRPGPFRATGATPRSAPADHRWLRPIRRTGRDWWSRRDLHVLSRTAPRSGRSPGSPGREPRPRPPWHPAPGNEHPLPSRRECQGRARAAGPSRF
ncbi:MAG: hypothetical protein M0C28_40150 [Candidatus Moduliflexus flocculans]|nr:hypothetical protein [Candidatus Moduliflexus flocculans]